MDRVGLADGLAEQLDAPAIDADRAGFGAPADPAAIDHAKACRNAGWSFVQAARADSSSDRFLCSAQAQVSGPPVHAGVTPAKQAATSVNAGSPAPSCAAQVRAMRAWAGKSWPRNRCNTLAGPGVRHGSDHRRAANAASAVAAAASPP